MARQVSDGSSSGVAFYTLGAMVLGLCVLFIKDRKQKNQKNRFVSSETDYTEERGDYSHPEGPNLGFESNETWLQTPQQRATSLVKTDLLHRGHRKGGKLLIVMVGMPGSGKTLIARKVARYLRWISYRTRSFSIAKYRLDRYGSKTSDYFSF